MNQRNCWNRIRETKNTSIDALRLLKKTAKILKFDQLIAKKKLFTEIDKNFDRVLKMILDIYTTYI